MDEQEFRRKYEFSQFQIITVFNPTDEDFEFAATVDVGFDQALRRVRSEQRHYRVVAKSTERFPAPVANLYLDQMSKKIAQQEGRFGAIADWLGRAQYYDRLINQVDDPAGLYQPFEEAQSTVAKPERPDGEREEAFAAAKKGKNGA